MKPVIIAVLSILLGSTVWLGYTRKTLTQKVTLLQDSLDSVRATYLKASYFADATVNEPALCINDSITEAYRITANYGQIFVLVGAVVNRDNKASLTFKRFSVKKPLTGEGRNELHRVHTQNIDVQTLLEFKRKLAEIDFLNATRYENNMCCFGGGSISLEWMLSDGQRHQFSTFCRNARQFAETCEWLLRHVDDVELKQVLGDGLGDTES